MLSDVFDSLEAYYAVARVRPWTYGAALMRARALLSTKALAPSVSEVRANRSECLGPVPLTAIGMH
jgi:hypothetical protein